MRRKVVIILVVVFAGGALLGLFVPRLLHKGDISSPTDFLSKHLSLSESQKRDMESLSQSFYAKVETIKAELAQKRGELSELLGDPSSPQEDISNKVGEITFLQAQFQRETINHLEGIKSLLTKDQQAKFLSLIRRRLHPGGPWRRVGGEIDQDGSNYWKN